MLSVALVLVLMELFLLMPGGCCLCNGISKDWQSSARVVVPCVCS